MIDAPTQHTITARETASIHLHIPVQGMASEFPKALAEISTVLQQQAILPAGPVFAHHFRRPTDTFDFNVSIPVQHPIASSGRVQPVTLPPLTVLRTTYYGDYAGLPHAWNDFIAPIQVNGPALRGDFLETYVVTPSESPDPASWRTELSVILAESHGGSR